MLSGSTILLFSLASILLALTPGPDMLYIATRAMAQGRSAGIVSVLGVHTGVLVHTLAAAMGVSALVAASAMAFSVIKYAGAVYLVCLGVHTLLSKSATLEVRAGEHARLRTIFYQGVATNVANPKVILFFLAFLPQFVDPARGSIAVQLLLLGILLLVVTLPIDMGVGLLGGSVGNWIRSSSRARHAGKWVMGSVFIALGISTALFGNQRS